MDALGCLGCDRNHVCVGLGYCEECCNELRLGVLVGWLCDFCYFVFGVQAGVVCEEGVVSCG